MGLISWIVLGLIAGVIANFLVGGGVGLIGAIILGIVGAVVGGFLADLLNIGSGSMTSISIESIVIATIGAIIVIFAYRAVAGRRTL
jgi:uncharacterized membrane protein YeaQ/YmgE (transglycosylase-associated protein family)